MQILGLSIDKPFLRIALMDQSKIIYLKSFLLSEGEYVKQLYKGKISSALLAKNLLMRSLEVNTGKSKHLEQAIAFQSETTNHFDERELISVPYTTKISQEKTEVSLFSASREAIKEHLDTLKTLKLDPDCVSAGPLALIDYIKWRLPDLQDAFLIDLGSEEWTCVCMVGGELKKIYSILGGTEAILASLPEDRKKNLPHHSSQLISMKQELARAIYSFSHFCGAKKPLFFTGRTDAFGELQEYLEEGLEDWVSPNMTHELPKEEQKYAIPIGLAIGYSARTTVQFRKDEFFPQKNWRRAGLYALSLSAASLLIGFGCIAFGSYALKSHKQERVSFLRTTLNQWDKTLAQKIFAGEDCDEILQRWTRAVETHSKDYTYEEKSPKVAEVLSWIYQHPLMNQEIEISFFRYRYPKIEIEFTTKSPLQARKFHEALHEGEGWVDSTKDIHWEVLENLYRASFFLKKENPHAP